MYFPRFCFEVLGFVVNFTLALNYEILTSIL